MGRHIYILLPILPVRIPIPPFTISIFPSFFSRPTLVYHPASVSLNDNHRLGLIESWPLHYTELQTLSHQDLYSQLLWRWHQGSLPHEILERISSCFIILAIFFSLSLNFSIFSLHSWNVTEETWSSWVYHVLLMVILPSKSWAATTYGCGMKSPGESWSTTPYTPVKYWRRTLSQRPCVVHCSISFLNWRLVSWRGSPFKCLKIWIMFRMVIIFEGRKKCTLKVVVTNSSHEGIKLCGNSGIHFYASPINGKGKILNLNYFW